MPVWFEKVVVVTCSFGLVLGISFYHLRDALEGGATVALPPRYAHVKKDVC